MTLVAAPIPVGVGVDTDEKLNSYICRVLHAAGKVWVARYVPLPGNSPANDISAYELAMIADSGLSCSLVQHCRSGHWDPALCSGKGDAVAAVTHALSAGYPLGAHLYLDLESMSGLADSAIGFANEWAATVRDGGYRAGCYHGFDVTLTPDQLFHALTFDSYWSAPGPWTVAVRGDAIKQGMTLTIANVAFDIDEIKRDGLGELPYCATATAASVA